MALERMVLIRHGQDQDNAEGRVNGRRDSPLTELGRQQAKEAANKLAGMNIRAIYSSPLQRARDTAQIIADEVGVGNIIIHEDLIERNMGILTGMQLDELLAYARGHNIPTIETPYGLTFIVEMEGGEHLQTVYERAKNAHEDIKQRHQSEETVVLVGHGMLGKMIYGVHNNLSWKETIQTVPPFENAGVYELKFKK